jgi:hypothetical protein
VGSASLQDPTGSLDGSGAELMNSAKPGLEAMKGAGSVVPGVGSAVDAAAV